ncbi:MAG: hypothetical protein AAF667_15855 [Pseudomonadota bacterium]
MGKAQEFNILIVGQAGRLSYEAILFAASLRHYDPEFAGRLIVAEPQPGPLWPDQDPRIKDPEVRSLLEDRLGAEILPFDSLHFGAGYPYGNKIEALKILPGDRPFVFFDTDTLITGALSQVAFDFDRPTASLKREGTWPVPELYGPGYTDIWKSLYDRFALDFASSVDPLHPPEYWQHYLYFSASFFFHRDPAAFHALFSRFATEIRNDPPPELVCQTLTPWLDQVALPLVIHTLGGGRDTLPANTLDGAVSYHWRALPLFFACADDARIEALLSVTAPNWIKKTLKEYDPFRRLIYQQKGAHVRAMFDQNALPLKEQAIRNRIKREGLWMR